AEADRAELGRGGMSLEMGRGATQVLLRLLDVQRHEELARAVRLAGRLAVVQVGSEGGEAGVGEAVAYRLDVGDHAPPFLDHEPAGALAAGRGRQVAVRGVAVARELHHRACHGLSFLCFGCRIPRSCLSGAVELPRGRSPGSAVARGGLGWRRDAYREDTP